MSSRIFQFLIEFVTHLSARANHNWKCDIFGPTSCGKVGVWASVGYHITNLNVSIFSIFKLNGFRIDCSDSFSNGSSSKEIHITVAPRS